MQKVVQRADGDRLYDELDGKPLQNGERLRVAWPDKTVTEEVCKIVETTQSEGERRFPVSLAYVVCVCRGVLLRMWLHEESIHCERVSEVPQ